MASFVYQLSSVVIFSFIGATSAFKG